MSVEPVRDRPGIRLNIGEAIAAAAFLLTVLSAFSAWWILPEKVLNLQKDNERQDYRLGAIEKTASDKAEILARIDERTKRIEEALRK